MYTSTMDTPTVLPAAERVIVIGDVHGDVGRINEMLFAMNIINKNMQWIANPPNTVVVQMGDQLDSANRVPMPENEAQWEKLGDVEVLRFMDELDTIARPHGGRVISLIGNHELMNVMGDFTYVSPKSMDITGNPEMRKRMFAPGGDLAHKLSTRNIIQKVGSLLFVHGGLLPEHLNKLQNNIHLVNEAFRKYLRKQLLSTAEANALVDLVMNMDGCLWTRKYIEQQQEPETLAGNLNEILQRTQCSMIFTGHNTIQEISTFQGKLWFTDSGFSRAYATKHFEAMDIYNDGQTIKIVRVNPSVS